MALGVPRRRYSEEEIAGAVLNVKANGGYIESVAERLGLNRKTLEHWVKGERRAGGAATRALMVRKQEEDLLKGYLDSALLAQQLAMSPEKLAKASSYQLTLMSGIDYDKYLLGTGRPTSRSEQVKARYVEGDSLRSIASRVVDVPALPALTRPDRTPKVAGGEESAYPLRQSAERKDRRKRTRKIAQNTPA